MEYFSQHWNIHISHLTILFYITTKRCDDPCPAIYKSLMSCSSYGWSRWGSGCGWLWLQDGDGLGWMAGGGDWDFEISKSDFRGWLLCNVLSPSVDVWSVQELGVNTTSIVGNNAGNGLFRCFWTLDMFADTNRISILSGPAPCTKIKYGEAELKHTLSTKPNHAKLYGMTCVSLEILPLLKFHMKVCNRRWRWAGYESECKRLKTMVEQLQSKLTISIYPQTHSVNSKNDFLEDGFGVEKRTPQKKRATNRCHVQCQIWMQCLVMVFIPLSDLINSRCIVPETLYHLLSRC